MRNLLPFPFFHWIGFSFFFFLYVFHPAQPLDHLIDAIDHWAITDISSEEYNRDDDGYRLDLKKPQ
jgi:hypothetical protein